MKKLMLVVLAAVLSLGVFSVDRAQAGEKIKLGFIVKQPEEPWFQLEWKFADEAAAKYGFDLIKIGAPDGEKVLAAIDSLASNGAKGFVICTPDVRLGPAVMNKAKQNNLKIMTVDDRFVAGDGSYMENVNYLGISARNIGREVGKILFEQMKARNWNVPEVGVCAITFDELDTTRERTDGAIEKLIELGFPKDQIFRAPQKYTDIPSALDATNILLTQQPNIKKWLVCGVNDSGVLGGIRAFEGRKFGPDSVIGVGINGTDCIPEFEKANPTGFYGSMLLSARQHGFQTAEMLYEWVANGKEPPLDTRTVGRLITRDTYKDVLKEEGITN